MMTSQVLRALEARGLVTRAPHPDDARARVLAPTDAGRRAVSRALPVVEDADAAFFAAAGDGLPGLVRALGSLAAAG
jgi:DNA-binding MarR family transcriptional regulator